MKSDQAYGWTAETSHCHGYIDEAILRIAESLQTKRVLDLGCGNGTLVGALQARGYDAVGCEPDEKGVETARKLHPAATFYCSGVYDPSPFSPASFDTVISTEVIEHLYSPEYLPRLAAQVLQPGGHLIISTPYHGYLKNVLIALAGKWDFHHHPTLTGMHIKFWSRQTLSKLLVQEGFTDIKFVGVGRMPFLWKSMIIVAKWPGVRGDLESNEKR